MRRPFRSVPAPCGLTVHRNLILIGKVARGVQRGRGRRIIDLIRPAVTAQLQFAAEIADNGLGDLIGPSIFIPDQVWVVRMNGPVMPAIVRIADTEGKTGSYIRRVVAMGFAPVR